MLPHMLVSREREAPLLPLVFSSGAFLPLLFDHHSSVLSFSLEAFTYRMNFATKVVH